MAHWEALLMPLGPLASNIIGKTNFEEKMASLIINLEYIDETGTVWAVAGTRRMTGIECL